MYFDSPTPSRSFIFTTLGLMAGLAAINASVFLRFSWPTWWALVITAIFSLVYIYCILVLHAGFHTRYTISDDAIDLRAGIFMHRRIPLDTVVRIDKTVALNCVVGWGSEREGYCNRFTEGVRIRLEQKSIYCSPHDTPAFLRAVHEARPALAVAKPMPRPMPRRRYHPQPSNGIDRYAH